MEHKPGHLQFDETARKPASSGTPRAVDFGAMDSGDSGQDVTPRPERPQPPAPPTPAPLFHDAGLSIAPALAHARATFPEFAKIQEHRLEPKLRQLLPWRHETVAAWGSKVLDENAATTTRTAELIRRYSEYRIDELAERATAMAQRGASSRLLRLFLRRKVISFRPALTVARMQLAQALKECGDARTAAEPLALQLQVHLIALAAAHGALAQPGESALAAAIHARRVLLQQAIHQAELTALQLGELKQQMAARLATVEQLLTITIPAFEIANAAR